jgi:tetratricopeptide (TPR) repeat protein
MKKQLLMLALSGLTTLTYAQKNEVKALEKAVKSEKFNETNSLISSAEALIANADDKTKAKFYYLKAKSLLNGNDYDGIVAALTDFDANNTSKYKVEIAQLKSSYSADLVNKAVADQGKGDQKGSAKKLYTAYKLSGDQDYLYYAASAYVTAKDYKSALPLYIELKDKGYTGVKTEYIAYNKETKSNETFTSKTMRDLSLRAGSHIKPVDNKTKSLLPDIIKNIAYMHVELGDTDAAVKSIKEARIANPSDVSLITTEANLYLKLGEKDKFKELMEEASQKDPTNPVLFFNLGVMSAEQGDDVAARKYYNKSLELNPVDINSNFNMAALILKGEAVVVDEMNSLGSSSADFKKYDILQEKRNSIYKEAVPYLEKILSIDGKNKDAANTLKNMYSAMGDTAKFKEMKALLETL